MMKRILSAAALCAALGSANAAVNVFPSPVNPAGLPADQVQQYAILVFDDNAYSGLDGTVYEGQPNAQWEEMGRVGGVTFTPWDSDDNPLEIQEGDMGMAWAIDGLGAPATFNMISGLYIDIFANGAPQGEAWMNYESDWGYFEPPAADNLDHNKIAVSWGREHEILVDGESIQPNTIRDVTQRALQNGHEIGNHTVDHLEANSPLPYQRGNNPYNNSIRGESRTDGFSAWGGDGFNNQEVQEMPWGETIDLTQQFGMNSGSSGTQMGWGVYAGRYISEEAWRGLIQLGEDVLVNEGNVPANGVRGFRAPRLEINSAQFFALADLGYLWDGGSEEGYEYHRDGTNFLWPYTVDNGIVNSWTQYSRGGRRTVDSLPTGSGLWNLHTNAVIVPEGIREQVWANHAAILDGAPDGDRPSSSDSVHWVQNNGKITAYDFNTWIMWGMEESTWLESMQHTMEQRLDGNRSPFHFGMHTDYHTPIYDNATLLSDFNAPGYGLVVTNNWNTWETRISAAEQFVTWAQGQGVEFVTATDLVHELESMASQAPDPLPAVSGDDIEFVFISNPELNSSASAGSFKGDFSGSVTIDAESGTQSPWATFNAYNLSVEDLNYISLDYKSTSALAIRLNIEGDADRQVILANANTSEMVSSGHIPLWAFDYDQYVEDDPEFAGSMQYGRDAIDPSTITGIEIKPLAPENASDGSWSTRSEPYDVEFSIANLTLYGEGIEQGTVSIIDTERTTSISDLAVNTLNNNALSLNVAQSGKYDVSVATASGRIVTSLSSTELSQGVNNIELNNLARGVYMINVRGVNNSQSLTQRAFVR
ncbi:polysaccharide deacetylase [Chitinivibrio alkaliphilus]|uniref:Polysaccharide deacetylase n=1 Tax=Chitinivibrio alkaliphilus ACht1 TaxID=1313304 RepID=U7D6N3_9BACT|nr:polysaccharide deacetylase [Chitinivibrio alkaliphilus]ERP31598.1 polysaccharide deacetylase [Chitinivibrio alkaliphilus ACht1]